MFLFGIFRYTKLIYTDGEKKPTKEIKGSKKRFRNADDDDVIDLTSNAASVSTQALDVTPKRIKTVSVTVPQVSDSADWGSALNAANPDFKPRLESKNPIIKKSTTPKTMSHSSQGPMPKTTRKGRPPKEKAQSPSATLTPKVRKGKEKIHSSPRDATPPIRSLDELRAAGLIEDETKLQGLLKGMYI